MLKCEYNLQNFTDRKESFNDLLKDTSMTVKTQISDGRTLPYFSFLTPNML